MKFANEDDDDHFYTANQIQNPEGAGYNNEESWGLGRQNETPAGAQSGGNHTKSLSKEEFEKAHSNLAGDQNPREKLLATPSFTSSSVIFDDADKDVLADLAAPTLKGEFQAVFKYIISNVKRDKKDIFIGTTTLIMIVVFTCVCFLLFENAGSLFYFGCLSFVGDMDIIVRSS